MTSPEYDRQRRLLEALVVGNRDLQQLEVLLSRFNIFAALGAARQELRHSNFLGQLLNPRQNHGLGSAFLKRFLQSALAGNTEFGPLEIELWQPAGALVQREWENIDITIRDDKSKIAVIIENKIDSEEGPNQLKRYLEIAERQFTGWKIIAIYLTPEGVRPTVDRYISMSYSQVRDVVDDVLRFTAIPNDEVRMGLSQYAEMLRRHIVAESNISELCHRIYEQHREAMDLIIEHRPDQRDTIRQLAEALVRSSSDLDFDSSSKAYVRFWIKSLDAPLLRQSTWTKTKRILLFEFDIYENGSWLRLYIGPGPMELRRRLYEMAKGKKPLNPSERLAEQWNTIFSRKLLDSDSYQKPKDELESELRAKWEHFVQHDLPQIVSSIKPEAWIFENSEEASKPTTTGE